MSENQPGPDHRPTDHDAGGESGMHELLGAYALDSVDVDERAAFEAHLATCSACAQELDELRAMLADLAESTAVAPPPALRARVLQGVTPSGTEGSPAPVPPGAPPPALPDNVRALRPAPGPSRRVLLAAAAAAVVA
ncbi:MAG: zf-HC2 domain-containing protein, partial [Nostocoides sp.]|uniref:zf-HC2 domain-containing protein n=1 Tax=Nostocoides sp. TaxID=1917966 RepID=UPI003C782EB1